MNLAKLMRPNTVSIFASDPISKGKVLAFALKNTAIPVPGRVRLDLTHSINGSNHLDVARSPVERVVADNMRKAPRTLTVQGSISAPPLQGIGVALGTAGSIVRRDLLEVKKLRALQDTREPVVVVTPFEIFPSMSMQIEEVHTGDNKVDLTLTFEEIRIVSPLTVAGVDLNTALFGASSATQAGAQPTELVSAPADIAGGVGG